MKKFMRIALVFALAGATLVGCTKDYSGDISDLNKKVAEQQSAVTALQNAVSNAQTAADNALANAQNALKEAQAAAKAAADANNDAEVAALTAKVATIEGEIADLEAKVKALDGLEAKLNEVAEQLKKDVDAKVDAALEEVRAELEKALAQVEGNFSVEAIGGEAKYASAEWKPETSKAGKANLAKLTEVFPELAEIKKGDKVETFGHIDFIVNPSSVALDDTYKFALIGKDGKDRKVVLGNPAKGFATKAGLNVWNVEVQSPAYNDKGKEYNNNDTEVTNLALVVENANGVYAQTDFAYTVQKSNNVEAFSIEGNEVIFKFDDTKSENSFDAFTTILAEVNANGQDGKPLFKVTGDRYEDYFIIEADPADVEEFGIEIEGSKIIFNEAPTRPTPTINFNITAVNVAGRTATLASTDIASVTLNYTKTIAPNAELAAQTVTLGYKDNSHLVPVKYNVKDFGFSALEWKTVWGKLGAATITVKDSKNAEQNYVNGTLKFYNASGKTATGYSDAVAFGFNIDSQKAVPGTYTVEITSAEGVFAGKGELTIANPETCPIKLIDALCKDGVLQIVGEVKNGKIEYALENALVYDSNEAGIYTGSFVDEDKANDDESWVEMPANTTFKVEAKKANLYKERNFSVNFKWFNTPATTTPAATDNYGTFEFKAQAVSPIYDAEGKAVVAANQTIYIGGDDETEFTAFEVSDIITSAKYVAGDKVGKPYNVFQGWKYEGKVAPTKKHLYNYTGSNISTESVSGAQIGWGDGASTIDNGKLVLDNSGEYITINTSSANILRGFGLKESEILTVKNAEEKLYLTQPMLEAAYNVWSKYYNDYGEAKTAASRKTDDEAAKTAYYCLFLDLIGQTAAQYSFETFKYEFANATASQIISAQSGHGLAEDNWATKIGKIKTGDTNAVAAYESIKSCFDRVSTVTADPGHDERYVKDDENPRATEIKKVTIAFNNEVEAAKFVGPTSITDPNEGNNDPDFIGVAETASQFLAGLTSKTLNATIKIEDNWGMTMEIPFTVTVKPASK